MDVSPLQQCPKCQAAVGAPRTEQEAVLYCSQCRLPQALVAGKYRITAELSEGGCGMLYLSRHIRLQMDPIRVIKFIKPEFCKDERIVKRLAREVEVTASLSQHNEHVVRVYDDFGEFPDLGHYFVMEYLQGRDLHQLLQREALLPFDQIFHIFRQICLAIRDAHEAHIVHRDLKPQNVFLITRRNDPLFVKVIDFGIAKTLANENATALTQGIIGTPEYMAPEQCSGRPVDHRTDIYALGTILYTMLVGHTPFLPPERRGSLSFVELAVCQMMEEPILPSRRRAALQVSPTLDVWMSTALAKKAEDRFSSVSEMLAALSAVEVELLGYPLSEIHGGESLTQPSVVAVSDAEDEHAPHPASRAGWEQAPSLSHRRAFSPLLATGVPLADEVSNHSSYSVQPAHLSGTAYDALSSKDAESAHHPKTDDVPQFQSSEPIQRTNPVVPLQPIDGIVYTREVIPSGRRPLWLWGVVGLLLISMGWGWVAMVASRRSSDPAATKNPLASSASVPKKDTDRSENTRTVRRDQPVLPQPRERVQPPLVSERVEPPLSQTPERTGSVPKVRTNPRPIVRRMVIRRPPKQKIHRSSTKRTAPRVAVLARTVIHRPSDSVQVSGCPSDGQTWIRFDLQPAQARVITSHRTSERYASWICIQRRSGESRQRVRISLQGYYLCFFLMPATGHRFRVKLQPSQGMNALEPDPHYCLQ